MKNITIRINTENAAFSAEFHSPEIEVARILKELAERIRNGWEVNTLTDFNGNKVGTVSIMD